MLISVCRDKQYVYVGAHMRACVCVRVRVMKTHLGRKTLFGLPEGLRPKNARPWSSAVLFQPVPHLGHTHMHTHAWSKVSCRIALISVYSRCMGASL